MRLLLASTLLLVPMALWGETQGNCLSPFGAEMQAGRELAIDVRSGDVEIAGAGATGVRVICNVRDGSRAEDVKISLAANHLRIYGGPNNNVRIRIEVPQRTNLLVRSPAGNVTISGVTGDKDVELRAGNLTILVGAPDTYRVVEGSVLAGDLNAAVFGVVKDGLFRSFRKDNASGQYRLRAKLLTGDLVLK